MTASFVAEIKISVAFDLEDDEEMGSVIHDVDADKVAAALERAVEERLPTLPFPVFPEAARAEVLEDQDTIVFRITASVEAEGNLEACEEAIHAAFDDGAMEDWADRISDASGWCVEGLELEFQVLPPFPSAESPTPFRS